MPPGDAKKKPTTEERQAIVKWIKAFRDLEAQRNAGDPGVVPGRRLSNAEYNYTNRGLTSVHLKSLEDQHATEQATEATPLPSRQGQ